jgi:hypothetical protein
MRIQKWVGWQLLMLVAFFTGSVGGFAFSLLGPYADWMDVQKGYALSGDIGGPMNIGEGYRWNLPVVTYGFDRSFLDYFGSNGVAAVEGAIAILNALPPASSIVLTNYPLSAWRINHRAEADHLLDLKTATLQLLLEQMGLTDPERYIFTVRDFHLDPYVTNYVFDVIERNFAPTTAQPSAYLNNTLFSYIIVRVGDSPPPTNVFCYTVPFSVDPIAAENHPAASWQMLNYGTYLNGLSWDDAGGLRYLLSGSEVRCESLLPDVHAAGTNTSGLVRTADRPGIEKVTFVRHPFGSLTGEFRPFTNRWTDIYYDWDDAVYQQVERVTARPDILFSGHDFGTGQTLNRTGTTNWANNAALNDNGGGAGPGTIQPPITLTYSTEGPLYLNSYAPYFINNGLSQSTASLQFSWGSFDNSTNAPLLYPNVQVAFQPTQVRFRLLLNGGTNDFRWYLAGAAYGRFSFQTTTNLRDWATLTILTNSGAAFSYQFQSAPNEANCFFRTIQQP